MGKMLLLLLTVGALPAVALAGNELFDTAGEAVRYGLRGQRVDILAVREGEVSATVAPALTTAPKRRRPFVPENFATLEPQPLAEIEPAAGGAPKKKEGDGHGGGAAKEGEAAKPAAVPKITIGGKEVLTRTEQLAKDRAETTPEQLQGPEWQMLLDQRFNIIPYAHSPSKGENGAPIQVVIFEDVGCSKCHETLGRIDAALHDFVSQTQVLSIYAASNASGVAGSEGNQAAFYGKVAGRMQKYWDFRATMIESKPTTSEGLFDALIKSGLRERDVRSLMMTDARRFYRELDADTLLARTFAAGGDMPVVFVNGIRVGSGGIPLEKLSDVLAYVSARIERGLAEPGP
ncbi:MAG: hypothetical protein EBQ80_02575 [Proteobacteria bacterium]|nr:hypothetical protein [Pseudomonadota bacterium]